MKQFRPFEITENNLKRIVEICQKAGEITLKYYKKDFKVDLKDGGSPVTVADKEASEYICQQLAEIDNTIPIISEEASLPTYEERKSWGRFWLVDPLDGTAEFIDGLDEFTVNVALIDAGVPVLGVVHVPAKEVTYYAGKSLGAWKSKSQKNERIFSTILNKNESAIIAVSRRHATKEIEEMKKIVTVEKTIAAGSSLKFCLVAEGLAHYYPRMGPTMEWDVAAGDCIYRNSAKTGTRYSSLKYNKPDLKNGQFTIGIEE